jgi:hypothetical protein
MRFDVPLERIFNDLDEKPEKRGITKEFQQLKFSKLDIYKNA